ncbi:MAG: sugar-binding protein [Planctomycetia bacterium]
MVVPRSGFLVAIGIVVAVGCGRIEPPVSRPAISPYACRFTEEPLVIDGVVDEVAWKDAVVIENFSMPWLGADAKPAKANRTRILWDRENLYVAADLDDADLYADITDPDGQTSVPDPRVDRVAQRRARGSSYPSR